MSASPQFGAVGALCAAALALTACGAESTVDQRVASVLADGAERLAEHLDADDDCRALAEAEALLDLTTTGHDERLIPTDLATEVEGVVATVTSDLTCEGPGEPDSGEAQEPTDEEAADEPSAEEESPPAEPGDDGASDRSDEPDDQDDRSGSGNGKGRKKGHEQGNGPGNGKGNGR